MPRRSIAAFRFGFAVLSTAALTISAFSSESVHQYVLPDFTTSNNFEFRTGELLSVPLFNTLNNRLVLAGVAVKLENTCTQQYSVTNVGQTAGFGVVRATRGIIASGPDGQFWGPPFGWSGSGPYLEPGQTGTATVRGTHTRTRGFGGLSAQPWVGVGSATVAMDITVTHALENPVQFTATHIGGTSPGPLVTVTYNYKCVGDIDEDGVIGVSDLLAIINAWGYVGLCMTEGSYHVCPEDVSPANGALWGDLYVGVPELLAVINGWGNCPAP